MSGDYGKPRPAVIIQTDSLMATDTVLVCLISSAARDSPLHRFSLPADEATGLRQASQVMVDKIFAAKREKCGKVIGRLDQATMVALGPLLTFVVGLRD